MHDSREYRRVRKDLGRLQHDVGSLAAVLGQRGKEKMGRTAMRMWEATKDLEHKAQAQLRDAGERAVKATRRGIGNHPLSSVAGALVVGIALGALLAMSCRRE